jgi:hypothetical protein
MKISPLDRILLLIMSLISAWQVAIGINGSGILPIIAYTIGFGTLVVSGLLLIIMGWEALESSIVVIISSLIPASLSLGFVWEYLPEIRIFFFGFVCIGFLAILVTRLTGKTGNLPLIILAIVHGVEGLMLSLLPVFLVLQGISPATFLLVGIGGAVSGITGLTLAFMKSGKPILNPDITLHILPGLMLVSTAALVIGFSL